MSGFEFLNLQVGGDFRVTEKLAVGPYLTYSFGQYGDPSLEEPFKGIAVVDSAVHSWLNLGLRGKFDL
jgi:hypothetical protein